MKQRFVISINHTFPYSKYLIRLCGEFFSKLTLNESSTDTNGEKSFSYLRVGLLLFFFLLNF